MSIGRLVAVCAAASAVGATISQRPLFIRPPELSSPAWSGYIPPEDGPDPVQRCRNDYVTSLARHAKEHQSGCATMSDYPPSVPARVNPCSAGECIDSCFQMGASLSGDGKWNRGEPRYGSAVWNESNGECRCYGQVQLTGTTPAEGSTCTSWVLHIPLGCLFTGERSCIEAPGGAGGCVWTDDACCIDGAGVDLLPFRELVPWWAWGVGAVLLLLSSLVGLLLRSRSRTQRRRFQRMMNGDDDDDDARVYVDREARDELVQQYTEFFSQILEAPDQAEPAQEDAAPRSPTASAVSSLGARTDGSRSIGSSEACPICFEAYRGTEVQALPLPCSHRLCLGCMMRVVRTEVGDGRVPTCPMCRQVVFPRLFVDENPQC